MDKGLNWYRNNPIVKMWRRVDTNSYFDTSELIKKEWNVPVFELGRVANTVEDYLLLLLKHIRKAKDRSRYTKTRLKEEFDLNDTETNFIYNRIYVKG